MSTLEKLSFHALTIDKNNYLSWSLDMKAHLAAKDLLSTHFRGTYHRGGFIAETGLIQS
jgi:hypothetical protein